MRRRPVIFDLDDTLIQSFPTYARLHQQVAAELGLPVPTKLQLVPYRASWEQTLVGLWPDLALADFVRRYDALADDNPYPAIPGAAETVAALRRAGHPLFIVTKRSNRRLALRLTQAGLDPALFDAIFPAELQPALKPDPRCFVPVQEAIGARFFAESIYVGDRDEDRRAAEGAGIRFLAVLTGPEVMAGFPGDLAPENVLPSVAEVAQRVLGAAVDP